MIISSHSAGRTAIASGLIGILAIAALFGYFTSFAQDAHNAIILQRFHDIFLILQLGLLIPLVRIFCRMIYVDASNVSKTMLRFGVGAIYLTIFFLLLAFPKILKDFLFMFPQGLFGVWLVIACWRLKKSIPQWTRWFGIIIGVGMTLVGIFPLAYALFVDSIILQIPAPSNEVMEKIPFTPANIFLHQMLWLGSLLGILPFPVWTILTGIRLLKIKSIET